MQGILNLKWKILKFTFSDLESADIFKEIYPENLKLLLERSNKARIKFIGNFICKDKACKSCQSCTNQNSPLTPCCFAKWEFYKEGLFVQYAFLTCVRAKDPKIREIAMTTFRQIANVDDNEEGSDIKKMIDMKADKWQFILTKLQQFDLVTSMTELLFSAIQAAVKLDLRSIEDVARSTLVYQAEADLGSEDKYVFETLLDQDGIFGFMNYFAEFVIIALSENRKYYLPAEMFRFNTDICAALVTIYKYGTEKYPWFEAMILNFVNMFRVIWITPYANELGNIDFVKPTPSKQHNLLKLSKSVLPRMTKNMSCGICQKKIYKTYPKIYPLCFQTCYKEDYYPREVARMLRPRSAWAEDVSSIDMDRCSRDVLVVCTSDCLVQALAPINPKLSEIEDFMTKLDKPFEKEMSIRFLQEYRDAKEEELANEISELKYFSLRQIVESKYPPYGIKIADKKQLCMDFKVKKRRRQRPEKKMSPCLERPKLPSTTNSLPPIPQKMREYHENMLLHDMRETSLTCCHHNVWGGWIKYHPVQDMEKYKESLADDGFSKSCISFQVKIDTCEQIDLNLRDTEKRNKLIQKCKELITIEDTLHVFPSSLSDISVDFLREKCHKVVLSGPANLDVAAMDKVFTSVNCLLGIWQSDLEDGACYGMIICKSPKTYFAFIPQSAEEFAIVLTENLPFDDIHECISALICTQICSQVGCESLQSIEKYNGSKSTNGLYIKNKGPDKLSFLSCKGFAIMRLKAMRMALKESFGEDAGKDRFSALNTNIHTECNMRVLNRNTNGLVRYSAKHLIGCSHMLGWKGTIRYHRLIGKKTWTDFHVTAWAFQCHATTQSSKQEARLDELWKLLPKELFILSMKFDIDLIMPDDKYPTIVLELGTAPKTLVDDIATTGKVRVAFISEDRKPKYVIIFGYFEGIIKGVVIGGQQVLDIYQEVRLKCFEMSDCDSSELFGEKGTKTADSWCFERKEKSKHMVHNESLGYLDKTLGKSLWTGELQVCITQEERVHGFEKYKEYNKLLQISVKEACTRAGSDELGAIKNSPFRAPTGHQVYSTYALISGTVPNTKDFPDLFSTRCKEESVGLMALNIERKLVENIIGSFKKCYFFYVHIQDSQYLHRELEDSKKTLLAFFVQKNELVRDILKNSATDMAKRIMFLKYDHRVGVIVAYVPKEKEKSVQIWKKLTNNGRTPILSTHEKMFKKIKRVEKKRPEIERVESHIIGDQIVEKSEFKENQRILKESLLETLNENNVTVRKLHVICIDGSNNKTNKESTDAAAEEEPEKKEKLEKDDNGVTATVFQVKETEDVNENESTDNEQNTGAFVKDNTSPDTDEANVKLSSIDLGSNLRKMFGNVPKKQLGARPKESEKDKESEKTKDYEKTKESVKKEKEKICWNCHASQTEEGIKLSKCKGCRKARYCDEECQSSDWERHSSYCEKMQEKRRKKEGKIEE